MIESKFRNILYSEKKENKFQLRVPCSCLANPGKIYPSYNQKSRFIMGFLQKSTHRFFGCNMNSSLTGISVQTWHGKRAYEQESLGIQPVWAKSTGEGSPCRYATLWISQVVLVVKNPFDPWVRKKPWRRAWQPTPVFLPGKFHGQREPGGPQSTGLQAARHN